MSDLCKKHKFGYEPLRLIASGCPLCLADKNKELHRALGHTEAALARWSNDEIGEVKLKNVELQAENANLVEALERIQVWSKAYPLSIFPKPDFKKAAKVLKAAGMNLDEISADNMRHVLDGIKDIVDSALKGKTNDNQTIT